MLRYVIIGGLNYCEKQRLDITT